MKDLEANDSSINHLPDDCLRHIFSFLPILTRIGVEKVCRRWRTISKRGWNNVKTLTIAQEYSDNTVHRILKRCGRFLRKLRINVSSRHPQCLAMIVEFCRMDQLEDIEISCSNEMNVENFIRDLREIFQRAGNLEAVRIHTQSRLNSIDFLDALNRKNLQILSFNDDSVFPRELNDEQLSINPDNFPNLRELELHDMEISEEEMEIDEGSLKGLVKLILHSCEIPESFFERIITFENLQELTLNQNNFPLTDEHIRDIARYCHNIREMQIIDHSELTSDSVEYLVRMPLLETLRWDLFENPSRSDLLCLVNLRHLILSLDEDLQIGDALIELIEKSPNLEKLTLWYYERADEALVNHIKNFFQSGRGRKHLYLILDVCGLSARSEICFHPLLTILYRPTDFWR